jgi:hypothetical protein
MLWLGIGTALVIINIFLYLQSAFSFNFFGLVFALGALTVGCTLIIVGVIEIIERV